MNSFLLLPGWLIALYIFIFGLCIGSFLNVAILRGLKGEDIVFGRSKCPKCGTALKWYMNIPLLSYIFLRGKCAFCSCKISIQYPLVEFICASFFVFSYLSFGFSLKALFACIFCSLFIVLCTTDFLETVIIDTHAYILLFFGLLYSFLKLGSVSTIESIAAAFVGFLIFEIFARLGKILCGYRMFGEGDSLIALGLGAIFGLKMLLVVITVSFLIQTVCALPLLAKNAFLEQKKGLAVSYIAVFVLMIFVFIINYYNFIQNTLLYAAIAVVICICLLVALKNIILEIKNKKAQFLDEEKKHSENEEKQPAYCLLPFGPALIFSAFICFFFLDFIKGAVKEFSSTLF